MSCVCVIFFLVGLFWVYWVIRFMMQLQLIIVEEKRINLKFSFCIFGGVFLFLFCLVFSCLVVLRYMVWKEWWLFFGSSFLIVCCSFLFRLVYWFSCVWQCCIFLKWVMNWLCVLLFCRLFIFFGLYFRFCVFINIWRFFMVCLNFVKILGVVFISQIFFGLFIFLLENRVIVWFMEFFCCWKFIILLQGLVLFSIWLVWEKV